MGEWLLTIQQHGSALSRGVSVHLQEVVIRVISETEQCSIAIQHLRPELRLQAVYIATVLPRCPATMGPRRLEASVRCPIAYAPFRVCIESLHQAKHLLLVVHVHDAKLAVVLYRTPKYRNKMEPEEQRPVSTLPTLRACKGKYAYRHGAQDRAAALLLLAYESCPPSCSADKLQDLACTSAASAAWS